MCSLLKMIKANSIKKIATQQSVTEANSKKIVPENMKFAV